MRAVKGRAAGLDDPLNRPGTTATWLPRPSIDCDPARTARLLVSSGKSGGRSENVTELGQEDPEAIWAQGRCDRSRTDARPPECFRCVDVPDTGDDPLIQKYRLDGTLSSGKRRHQSRRREARVGWLGTQLRQW